jgi:tight adherence protein B
MGVSSITLLVFAATVLLVISLGSLAYDFFLRYRLVLRERVQELSSKGGADHSVQLFKGTRRLGDQDLKARTLRDRLTSLLEQAGVACSLRTFGAWCAGAALACGALGWWMRGWLGMAFLPIGGAVPLAVVCMRRHARRRKLCRQLPEAFQMISRAVRAGQTVPSALKIIADDFDAPISEEFALCYEQQNLGVSREAALRKLARRTGIMELQIFVVALLVQARSGGNLVELLDNLALTVRKRMKLSERVRALTGEGRMQARVLLILPIAALIGLMTLSPEYAAGVLSQPWLLAGTAAAQAVGVFWIRRIVNFQY